MYWEETEDDADGHIVSDDVVDLLFSIRCKTIPIDHGEVLKQAICNKLGWLETEPYAAIHQIHVAESSHGWQRPDEEIGFLLPSRRTRLILRMPFHRIEDCRALIHHQLDIQGHNLAIGEFKARPLSKLTTVFSRYIESDMNEAEEAFIERILNWLREENVHIRKMMCGLQVKHRSGEDFIKTRKLMLSGLSVSDSLRLQKVGIGNSMLMGIGIFLPHKGIDAVKSA
ncbi:MAG: type I-MYXAN CRISPR-associated protein Cas6/Cmx6 [Gammaproteobacteria bacterium]|nr:type I-MYXAN CRISPR-associated protein Cas6/Cmx6 [Gammaproteobacteria bacterium]